MGFGLGVRARVARCSDHVSRHPTRLPPSYRARARLVELDGTHTARRVLGEPPGRTTV